MRRRILAWGVVLVTVAAATASSQSRGGAPQVAYHGARLILGDSRPPIERGTILVQDGRIIAVGPDDAVKTPAGASRVDLAGKTVMTLPFDARLKTARMVAQPVLQPLP